MNDNTPTTASPWLAMTVVVLFAGCSGGSGNFGEYSEWVQDPLAKPAATESFDTEGADGSSLLAVTDVPKLTTEPAVNQPLAAAESAATQADPPSRTIPPASQSGAGRPTAENGTASIRNEVPAGPASSTLPGHGQPAIGASQSTNSNLPANGGKNLDPAPQALASPPERKWKLLVPEKTFNVAGPQGAVRASYDDLDLLKVLNMDPVTPDVVGLMPDWLKGLNGKRIRLRGYMYPTFQESDIPFFLLARDNQICCFGRNPKIYDIIEVKMRENVTTDYIPNRPFDVVGVFHIDGTVIDGKLQRLYQITDAIVIDR